MKAEVVSERSAYNKPLTIMAADVKAQTSVLRKNVSDYPQCSLLETATIATGKTLGATQTASPINRIE